MQLVSEKALIEVVGSITAGVGAIGISVLVNRLFGFVKDSVALRKDLGSIERDKVELELSQQKLDDARACSHYLRASMMRAKLRKPRKSTSSFSKREKILRKPLSLRKSRSISLRFL